MTDSRSDAGAMPSPDKSFLSVLDVYKHGGLISEVSSALKQCTAAVQDANKPGTVTLTMKLRPAGKNSGGTLVFEGKVKAALPEKAPPDTVFYADGDFNLVREDPAQQKLDLRVVETAQPVELRKVSHE